jgi:type I restriction enzyme R subunit
MSELRISEAGSAQFPMVNHAVEVGWTPITPDEAKKKRGGESGMFFQDELREKITSFNPWLSKDAITSVIETLDAIPATVEGNRDMLDWLRGQRQWYNEAENRHDRVQIIDFEHPELNSYYVSWEWTLKPPARKGNRADVMFIINGIPACIVEHKNPKSGDAIERGITQLRRYEKETPELIGSPQIFNVTHVLEYWYGVTWNATRRDMARWKQKPEETYRYAVQSFFEINDFLRTLEHWILFYVEDNETRKSILRQHQRKAIDKIIERCAEKEKKRGLIWHTQGSGKTFTLLTAAKLMLEDKDRFNSATVILIVDRIDLEVQLGRWVDRLIKEMETLDIAATRAKSKPDLQRLLDAEFRGLILSTIHKFDGLRKNTSERENIYVFIDEAHRSVAKDLGTYLMAALPNATLIGFTGTPIAKTQEGKGTFKIFGNEDDPGYLDKYSIKESIDDKTTLPIKHMMAPSTMLVPAELLDKEFFELTKTEGVTDIDELNRILDRSVKLKTFLTADDRVEKVAAFAAKHFKENVLPLGYKAFLVGVNREVCAKYKKALDKHLPPEWSVPVYNENAADAIERPLLNELQLSDVEEDNVRRLFRNPKEDPKILIVTDKLLTGYDAPVLYCMYLDKPMRDHVLLQAIARVNRPYIDEEGKEKTVGLIVDFVGVLRELKKALQFDSEDVSGVIDDLDLLLKDFIEKIAKYAEIYLDAGEGGAADERLEKVVYGRFLDPKIRKEFFQNFKEIEDLWEILSPSAELRDYIETYKLLAGLYAAVRNAYSEKGEYLGDLAYKTRRLIEENAVQLGLGEITKTVTFDVKTLEALRKNKDESDESKIFNLVRGLRKEIEDDPNAAPLLQSLKERAERIIKALEDRKTTNIEAMDLLEALIYEKDIQQRAAKESGLSMRAYSAYVALQNDNSLIKSGIAPLELLKEAEVTLAKFPNASVNSDEERLFRSGLYRPLLKLPADDRARIVAEIASRLII